MNTAGFLARTALPRALLISLLGGLLAVHAENPQAQGIQTEPASVEARIGRVQNRLAEAVRVKGRPESAMALMDRMRHYKVPGVSIAVINDDKVEWARGYGVTEADGTRVDSSTLFQAGSISKPLATMAALYYVERGAFDLNEDVNRKLLSWHVPENDLTQTRPVTLRRLLSHSAGLTVSGFPGYAEGAQLPTLVQVLNGEPPANTRPVRVDILPGSRWRYSGGGFAVVQLLLEDQAHKPLPAIMQEVVLEPLDMLHSTFEQPLPAARAPFAASGHEPGDSPVQGRWHTYPEMTAAGLWTTPSDLAHWAIEVQRAYKGQPNGILSMGMTHEMLTVQSANWGLGLTLEGTGESATFGHRGQDKGFTSRLVAFVEGGQGVVVMTNAVSFNLIDEIIRSVAHEYDWSAQRQSEKAVTSVDPEGYKNLVSRYRFDHRDPSVEMNVSSDGKQLFVQTGAGAPDEILPQTELGFFSHETGTEYTFVRDGGGQAGQLIILRDGGRYVGDRIL